MPSRKKIGTLLDETLLRRAKVRAAREGKALNELFETALETYLSRAATAAPGRGVVDKGWGAFRVTRRQLEQALHGDLLDA